MTTILKFTSLNDVSTFNFVCNADFAFVYLGSHISLQSDIDRGLSPKSSKSSNSVSPILSK